MIDPAEVVQAHQRWLQAVAQGEDAARAATRAAFQGCATALAEIGRELKALGYPVDPLIQPCAPNSDELIAEIAHKTGLRLPAVLIEFWNVVGGVAFIEFENYAHTDFWDALGVRAEYCDGLFVDACVPGWVDFVLDSHERHVEDVASGEWDEPFCFELAPDGYHKDNISGGLPYGLRTGSDWLPLWENFSWVGQPLSAPAEPVDFVGYLRTAVLECAGFPGLFGDEVFEPIRQRLLQNVKVF